MRQEYDNLNRVWRTTTVDSGGIERAATTDYHGLVQDLTNARLQHRTETRDVIGQLTQVLDSNVPIRGVTAFEYDPFGNLSKTIDPNGNVINVQFDRLGRKTQLIDPDLGQISYSVNPLGRVWAQSTPMQRSIGKKTYFEHDLLGRMVGRYEKDLESHWRFDTAANGIGQLAEAYTMAGAVRDYSRTYSYDALGRVTATTQQLFDGLYTSGMEYDAWNRPITNTYQRGSDGKKVFSTRYNSFGYLDRIERGNLVLWQAAARDASDRPTGNRLGNGLTQSKVFNHHSDRLESAAVVTSTGVGRLQKGYTFDVLGNVLNRT